MKRLKVMLWLLCVPTVLWCQSWHTPTKLAVSPGLEWNWRFYGTDPATNKNAIEWMFRNRTDSLLEFDYLVQSNRLEKRNGRILLKPKKKTLSAWMFEGDSVTIEKVENVVYRANGRKIISP